MIYIDRCVCFQKTFAFLREKALEKGCTSLRELQQHATFGENCKLCHPYVTRMLETGQTVFQEVLTLEQVEKSARFGSSGSS